MDHHTTTTTTTTTTATATTAATTTTTTPTTTTATATTTHKAAKHIVEYQLCNPLNCDIAKQEDVPPGRFDPFEGLPVGYKVPAAGTAAHHAPGTGECATYSGSLPFFCDPFGSDLWTVCVTKFTVRVAVEGGE